MRPAAAVTLLLSLICAPLAGTAASLPEPVIEQGYPLQKVGAGRLRWLGFTIYDASLWTSTGRYAGFAAGETVALSLDYERGFSRDELLRITDTAWRKLGDVDAERRARWIEELRSLWSDVRPGDNVTTIVVPGGPTRFYDRARRFGQVDDPAFGPAFLSIWLDPRSVVNDLRIRLIGGEFPAETTAAN